MNTPESFREKYLANWPIPRSYLRRRASLAQQNDGPLAVAASIIESFHRTFVVNGDWTERELAFALNELVNTDTNFTRVQLMAARDRINGDHA